MKHSINSFANKYSITALLLFAGLGDSILSAESVDLSDVGGVKKDFRPSFESGGGTLTINEGSIAYTVEDATEKDFQYLLYRPARLRASQDFTIMGSFKNDAIAESSKELASVGIEVYQAEDLSNRVAATLSVARLEGVFSRTVFTQIVDGGETAASTYTPDLRVPIETTFKLVFDSKEKVFTTYYDSDEGEGVEWTQVGSFGINGKGGEDGDGTWRMKSTEKFLVYVYGYSENLTIYEGEVEMTALSVEVE